MADIVFKYAAMPYLNIVAAREAVLKPILKGLKDRALQLPIDKQHEKLQKLWRTRVMDLTRAGWGRTEGYGFQYLRNCPPFGVFHGKTGMTARSCQCRRVCPNCYARLTVSEAYRSVEWAFYLKSRTPLIQYDLLAIRKTWHFDEGLPRVFEIISRDRNVYLDMFKTRVGGVVVSTLSPDRGGWQVSLSTLVAAHSTEIEAVDLGKAKSKKVRYSNMTKRKLAMAVGWALTYPVGMMYGPEADVAELLKPDARKQRANQISRSGAMKNKIQRELTYR